MNNEQLTAYLKDESYLYSLSFEELRTLVLQYPYAANLRVLLLKKSYLEQNKDYDRHLQMASAYTTNRRFLYKAIKKLKTLQNVPENVILGEDYLELTELSNIEKILSERHVTEVYSEIAIASTNSLQLDWGSAEFQNTGSETNEIHKVEEDLIIPDILPATPQNISKEQEVVVELTENVDSEVAQTIENIILEFGSKAIDLTGISAYSDVPNTHVTTLDALSDSVLFIEEEEDDEDYEGETEKESDSEAEPPCDIEEEEPREIPYLPAEPFDFDALEEIKSPTPDEYQPESQIIDEEIRRFEELNDNEVFIPSEINFVKPVIEEDEDVMKRPEVEMEIVNQSKAVLVENIEKEPVSSSQPSFSEWLKQFKMPAAAQSASSFKPNTAPKKQPEVFNIKTPPEPAPVTTSSEAKHILDTLVVTQMFEQPIELPDNLFGLNESIPSDILGAFLTDGFADAEEVPKKKKKKKQMHDLAAKSIEENSDLVSETLADLLAAQGNNQKAIEMYFNLSLQIPEKSDYFAAKIEKLRINT